MIISSVVFRCFGRLTLGCKFEQVILPLLYLPVFATEGTYFVQTNKFMLSAVFPVSIS